MEGTTTQMTHRVAYTLLAPYHTHIQLPKWYSNNQSQGQEAFCTQRKYFTWKAFSLFLSFYFANNISGGVTGQLIVQCTLRNWKDIASTCFPSTLNSWTCTEPPDSKIKYPIHSTIWKYKRSTQARKGWMFAVKYDCCISPVLPFCYIWILYPIWTVLVKQFSPSFQTGSTISPSKQ